MIIVKKSPFLYKNLTYEIIGAAMEVHRELGPGFLESLYEKAFTMELRLRKINVEVQKRITVKYKGSIIGKHILDMLIEGKVIVELKVVQELNKIFEAQLISYMKATGCRIGLLINFAQESLEYKRILLKDNLLEPKSV